MDIDLQMQEIQFPGMWGDELELRSEGRGIRGRNLMECEDFGANRM